MIETEEQNQPVKTAVFTMAEMSELKQNLQILLQVFPDGQVHLAFRGKSYETWSRGTWSILTS